MLEVKNLCFAYGNIPILRGLNFTVEEGGVTSIVGSNGVGKSTTLLTISCCNRAQAGTIEFCGERIEHLAPHEVASRGLVHVPEGRELFPNLTVFENLEMGSAMNSTTRRKKAESLEYVFSLFPHLIDRKKQLAGSLSGGEQQMLAIGRALMSRPRLLLLDEPSLGLAPIIVGLIFRTIRELNAEGLTILLVEQNAKAALRLAHRGYVMESGRITKEGKGSDLLDDPDIKKAYLGE